MATQPAFSFANGAVIGIVSYDETTQLATSLTCTNTTEQAVSYQIWDDGGNLYQGTLEPGIDSATFDTPLEVASLGMRADWAA